MESQAGFSEPRYGSVRTRAAGSLCDDDLLFRHMSKSTAGSNPPPTFFLCTGVPAGLCLSRLWAVGSEQGPRATRGCRCASPQVCFARAGLVTEDKTVPRWEKELEELKLG